MKWLTLKETSKGTVRIDNKLVAAVREMERGALPPASLVRRLLVTPPGQRARIIRPTAKTGDKPNACANPNAISGSRTT